MVYVVYFEYDSKVDINRVFDNKKEAYDYVEKTKSMISDKFIVKIQKAHFQVKTKKINQFNINNRLRFELFKRDGFTCQYCGSKAPDVYLEIDDIVPKSKGGSDDISNLITSCKSCNIGKSNTDVVE